MLSYSSYKIPIKAIINGKPYNQMKKDKYETLKLTNEILRIENGNLRKLLYKKKFTNEDMIYEFTRQPTKNQGF